MLSVIIPASNEADRIGACLRALFASKPVTGGAEAVVVANGCRDDTADQARALRPEAEAAGWTLVVVELLQGSKPLALNAGDRASQGDLRAYLDADVLVSSLLMPQIALALADPQPAYATGRPVVTRAQSWITRAYARFWSRLPFAEGAAPGFGLYAVNSSGRARWGDFPALISDDTFVRLQFMPGERVECPAIYYWPMVEGWRALVRVRRRQDAGVAELARLHPALMAREGKARLRAGDLLRRALAAPVGFIVYAAVSLAVRLRRGGPDFVRGR